MKKILGIVFTVMTVFVLSAPAWAVTDITDLWDVHQGNVVTGTSNAGVYPGSDIRNMFGGEYGTMVEVENTIFPDAQIFSPGSLAWVSWETPTAIDLDRFVLSVAADGNYPTSYNRAIQGFNLYASNIAHPFDSNWGDPIYSSGLLPRPLGTYNNGLYFYTIDHTFSNPISAQHFKADIVYGSYVTGPRIIELDGYGPTPVPSAVPEPASMLLFGSGLVGMFFGKNKRQ